MPFYNILSVSPSRRMWELEFTCQNGCDWKNFVVLQSLEYETEKTVLFWGVSWHKNFVCKNCETNLGSECAPKPPWPTGFEKSKIPQPNPEKLQFEGSKI